MLKSNILAVRTGEGRNLNLNQNQAVVLGHTCKSVCFRVNYKSRLCLEAKLQSRAQRCPGKYLQEKQQEWIKDSQRSEQAWWRVDGQAADESFRQAPQLTIKYSFLPAQARVLLSHSNSLGYRCKEKNAKKMLVFASVAGQQQLMARSCLWHGSSDELFCFWRTRTVSEKGTPKLSEQ